MKEINNLIDNAAYVSFDVFDTLIIRKVYNPTDIFIEMGQLMGIENFKLMREKAQQEAFQEMHRRDMNEITLDGIYKRIELGNRDQLKDLEIERELYHCMANPEMKSVYDYCKKNNKKIVICSDMYLPDKAVAAILESNGITGYDKLLVSSTENATKRDRGELFDKLIEHCGSQPSEILHIGDNLHSDIKMAEEKGLNVFYYKSIPSRIDQVIFTQTNNLFGSHYNALKAQNSLNKKADFWYDFGYYCGGPLHKSYLNWLEGRFKKDQIDLALFLSRDGYLLEQEYQKKSTAKEIPGSYLLGSRIPFTLAAINGANYFEYLDFLSSGCFDLNLMDIFQRADLPFPPIHHVRKVGFNAMDDIITSQEDYQRLRRLFIEMREPILLKCSTTKNLLKQYWEEILGTRTNIALVDVGWSGSSVEPLVHFMKKNFPTVTLSFYFLSLMDTEEVEERINNHTMKAHISSPSHNQKISQWIYPNRAVIELLFSAPHLSVINYRRNNGKIEPLNNIKETRLSYENEIRRINQGILDFIQDIDSLYFGEITARDAITPLMVFLNNLSQEEIKSFNGIKGFDGWGLGQKDKTLFEIA